MANIENNSILQMHQKLKQLFPEIPDEVIFGYARLYPHDMKKCVELLRRHSPRYAFLSASGAVNAYQNKNVPVYNTESYQPLSYSPDRLIERAEPEARLNGFSLSPRLHTASRMGPTSYNHHPGSPRSFSVTGAPPSIIPPSAVSEFNSSIAASAQQHPRSAPVMPTQYEPFQMEYTGKAEMTVYPGTAQIHMKIPVTSENSRAYPLSDESFYDQHRRTRMPQSDQYTYEMHVRCTQVKLHEQRCQKERLRSKLFADKKILDDLRADVIAMEKELEKRRVHKSVQNPSFPYEEIKKLREETTRLRGECNDMSQEVDRLVKGQQVPLGETSLDFYTNINPGQIGSVGVAPKYAGSHVPLPHTPSQPQPSRPNLENEDQEWSCPTCTFLNNAALNKCEMCEMARFPIATDYVDG